MINEAELNIVANLLVHIATEKKNQKKTISLTVQFSWCYLRRQKEKVHGVERCSYSTVGFLTLVVLQLFCLHIPSDL